MTNTAIDGVYWEVCIVDADFYKKAREVLGKLLAVQDFKNLDDLKLSKDIDERQFHTDNSVRGIEGAFYPSMDKAGTFIWLFALYKELHDTRYKMGLAYEKPERGNEFSLKIEDHENYLNEIGYTLNELRPLCEAVGLMLPELVPTKELSGLGLSF